MDLDWSPEDSLFREEVRAWLAANAPAEARPRSNAEAAAFDREWQAALFAAGWAGINWPQEYGGRGLSIVRQMIWYEEYAKAGAPPMGFRFVAQNHAGPTLIACGTEAQKAQHLAQILKGEELWCQGFSEPGAGSDLASLTTRGVVDGEDLVVSGQKVWTSGGDQAEFQELLVRTDPESHRHKGLTWIICPMHSPGVEVHTIRKMNGRPDFCSVFYDEVRIPLSNVVGALNQGWTTAMATLGFERGTSFLVDMVEITLKLERLVEAAKTRPLPGATRPAWRDDEYRRRLAGLRAQAAALRAMNYANLSRYANGAAPGSEGSITKLLTNQTVKALNQAAIELMGPAALAWRSPDGEWADDYLHGLIHQFGGGSPDIQREIIADRVLELPRSR